MPSLFNTAISGLHVSQRAIAIAGHNIANADTPGFSRQRVDVVARSPTGSSDGIVGRGAQLSGIERLVNTFANEQLRSGAAAHAGLSTYYDLAQQLDNVMADQGSGFGSAMNSFFSAINDLNADPTSPAARQLVLASTDGLVQRAHAIDTRLASIRGGVETSIAEEISEINALSSEVANLNGAILLAESAAAGQPANDLRDRRDEQIRNIATHVSVSVATQDNGSVNVFVGAGQPLVVGQQAVSLGTTAHAFDPARTEVAMVQPAGLTPISSVITGGALGGLLRFRDDLLEPTQNALGRVAMGLTTAINEQHALGVDLNGAPGGDWFADLTSSVPRVLARADNTGSPGAQLSVSVETARNLTGSDYRLDRVGASYTLTRLDDGTVSTLGGFPGSTETVDGISLSLASGNIADGDSFLVQPTRFALRDLQRSVLDTASLAVAAPVRATTGLSNLGTVDVTSVAVNSPYNTLEFAFTSASTVDVFDRTSGATLATGLVYTSGDVLAFNGVNVAISGAAAAGDVFTVSGSVSAANDANSGGASIGPATVLAPDANLTDPVTFTFNDPPTTFNVSGATTGIPIANIPYVAGETLSFNGWQLRLSGTPVAGDSLVVSANINGIGDNRNGLALLSLQTQSLQLSGGASFEEDYVASVSRVGTATRQSEVNRNAQQALLDQSFALRQQTSGVSLDEEAANLLRYQRAYQASAQLVAVADELLQTLLAATGR